jgi:hypothetical protein
VSSLERYPRPFWGGKPPGETTWLQEKFPTKIKRKRYFKFSEDRTAVNGTRMVGRKSRSTNREKIPLDQRAAYQFDRVVENTAEIGS